MGGGHGRGRRTLVGILVVATCAASGVAAQVSPAAAGPARAGCVASPFTAEVGWYVEARYPGHHLTADVFDEATGCEYQYHAERRLTTASVIKVEIMAGILLRAQDEGRGLTQWERDRLWGMITESLTPPTQDLWISLGGIPAMRRVDQRFGLHETDQRGLPSGDTLTSAHDRTLLIRQVLGRAGGPLAGPGRDLARSYMAHVVPSQQWGIRSGVPTGWEVVNKNGFFPRPCCAWRIGSTGHVRRGSASYAVTVMSDGWSTERQGIDAVEELSRIISATFAPAPVPPFHSADAAVVQQYADLLRTHPDIPTRLYLDGLLSARPAALAELATSLLTTAPWSGDDLDLVRVYDAALGRLPTFAELEWWSELVHQRAITVAGVAGQLAASSEFKDRWAAAADDAAFVDLLYRKALGRPLNSDGKAHWLAVLAARGRSGVVRELAQTPEFRARHRGAVDASVVYRALLRRAPDDEARRLWAAAGASPHYAIAPRLAKILASDEYRRRVRR
ncbi:MAG: hypothetical protein JWM05_648 [Acidimicrobiales bacterium]|nr:hypothetical protein [Acidimicrobiales bacterium]